MQWLGIAISLLAMFGAGIFVTWLWQRRSTAVLRESVRERVQADTRDKLSEAQSLSDDEAWERARTNAKKFGGEGQK
jgi:hypothetical protein